MSRLERFFHPLFFFTSVFFGFCSSSYPADTRFYTLNERWEKATPKTDQAEAVEEGFRSALSRPGEPILFFPPSPAVRKTLDEITSQGTYTLEQGQSLYLEAHGAVTKFLETGEGIVDMETIDSGTLHIVGKKIGQTFIHVWDALGRHTFQLLVYAQPYRPSREDIRRREILEKSRPFRFGYVNNRSAFYQGAKYQELARSSIDASHKFSLEGDTPYGFFYSDALLQKDREKHVFTNEQAVLYDGRIGPYRNFNLHLGDTPITPDLIAFPQARVRGFQLHHWNNEETVKWNLFEGREQVGLFGPISPALVAKRNIHSYLSGGYMDIKNDRMNTRAGLFYGSGDQRPVNSNHWGMGMKGEYKLTPHVFYNPDVSFDSERTAQRQGVTVRFDTLTLKNEYRNFTKDFATMVGSPANRGELGYLVDLLATPQKTIRFRGLVDHFRDRTIPNPADLGALNRHREAELTLMPTDRRSFVFSYRDYDDTGRASPSRQRTGSAQWNEVWIDPFNHRYSTFLRYQNQRYESLTREASDYERDQFLLGLYTQIFWDLGFSIQREWNVLQERLADTTHPSVTTYSLDYSRRLWDTPFYLDLNLRYRDEEETESENSFMAGEDTTELQGTIRYRESQDLEFFATTGFTNRRREKAGGPSTRVEAKFISGVRGFFDTDIRWASTGNFKGHVFKDLNANGQKEADEPGIPDVTVTAGKRSAVTDANGLYEIKGVSGKRTTVTVDASKIPYGFAPTSASQAPVDIEHHKTKIVDFGFTPRSEVAGVVFQDINEDERYNSGDIPVPGVKIVLEDGKTRAVTNNSGAYTLRKIVAGDHTASLDLSSLPQGFVPAGPLKKSFTLTEGLRYELNFIVRASRQVSGRVFVDENRNGRMDENEPGVAAALVVLGSRSSRADQDGWFLFDDVASGDYPLTVDPTSLPEGLGEPSSLTIEMPQEPTVFSNKHIAVKKISQ